MTIQDFHNNFDIEVDKTIDYEYPYILAEQKDYWLNKAQDRVINDVAYPKTKIAGFEQDQQKTDELRSIVKRSTLLTPILSGTIYSVTLPNDYRYLVRHQCTTNGLGSCGTKIVGGIQTNHEYINQMLKDPFWTPTDDYPLYYFLGNTITYETKGNYILINTIIDYIKEVVQMRYGTQYINPTTDIQCEIGEILHQRILDTAVSMFLENIESQRYQSNLNELNKTE